MCRRGSRCSAAARESLQKAARAFEQEQTPENTQALREARKQYAGTAEGIRKLREQNRHDLADKYSRERKQMLANLKEEDARFRKFSASLKDVDEEWLGDRNLRPDLKNPVVRKAFTLAVLAHKDVRRKSGEPYINHPLRTAKHLERLGYGVDVIATAVLHDAVEDSDLTLDDLRRHGFSERIVAAVDSVTKRPGEEYGQAVLRASQNPIGQLVKLADNLDNSSEEQLKPFSEEKRAKQIRKYSPARGVLIRAIYGMGTYTREAAVDGVILRPNVPSAA